MNNASRIALALAIALSLGACTKKVKEVPPTDTTAPADTAEERKPRESKIFGKPLLDQPHQMPG